VALLGDYRVSYTSSPQAAGGRFRSGLGRALFRTHALYQNVLPPPAGAEAPLVANRVEFALLGVPGAVGLTGPLKPVAPLLVAPRDNVSAGDGVAVTSAQGVSAVARSFQGAVEVAFDPPFLEVAGSRVTLGGASTVRLATTFLDDRVRIGRGGFGSLFVFERMGDGEQAKQALVPTASQKAAGWFLARAALLLFFVLSTAVDAARLGVTAATTPPVAAATLMCAAAVALAAGAAPAVLAALAQAPHAALASAHLVTLACWLGATLWVTFGQGDLLFKALPRHDFSRLRAALRPRFLAACCAAGATALACHAALWGPASAQVPGGYALPVALAATAANMLWAEPAGSRLGRFRDKFEVDADIGKEVGVAFKADDPRLTPTLRRLAQRIGRLRAASVVLTLAALAALMCHVSALAALLVV
jgi:hypothetical protein